MNAFAAPVLSDLKPGQKWRLCRNNWPKGGNMECITGPCVQKGKSTFTWWVSNFALEPGGVVVTAEALNAGDEVTSANSGSHQPTYGEAAASQNPYKSFRLDVTTYTVDVSSFYILGIGG